MPLENKIILITYADSFGENLEQLTNVLAAHFSDLVGGVHLLPFFPSSADRGFAPTRYDQVDPQFGTWAQVQRLTERFDLTVDFMINHVSRDSEWFQDFLRNRNASPFAKMFILWREFWGPGGPTESQVDQIYKRKPRAPFVSVRFQDGSSEDVWCTFDDKQIDLNLSADVTRDFIRETLENLAGRGASVIRLDAFAYSIKKPDTSCFFVEPDVWDLLEWTRRIVAIRGVELLPEIHEHYSIQLELASRGYWVYDFALPMLVLHTLYFRSATRLIAWLRICPRKQFTTLDTHDGIGVVDVKGLLSDDEIAQVQDHLYSQGANVKRIYSSTAYKNLDVYQINTTFYSALGCSDDAYLLARAIQFFTPGIPQVYYVGLLAGENDVELVERTKNGRDINRHAYSVEEIERNLSRSVVRRLHQLIRFRNKCKAFSGELEIEDTGDDRRILLNWRNGGEEATLSADLRDYSFEIRCRGDRAAEEFGDSAHFGHIVIG